MSNDGGGQDLAETLAEFGRTLGQAITDALEQLRRGVDAVAELADRPEIRALIERTDRVVRRRPCLCLCARAHPNDHGICEILDAVITGRSRSDLLGDLDVPLCAPCAAARAVNEFVS